MAAITLASLSRPSTKRFHTLKAGIAQADTGQTIWVPIPAFATQAVIMFSLTGSAGTTPVTNITVKGADPVALDDTYSYHITGVTITAQNTTATSGLLQVIEIGAPIGVADDVILGATGVNVAKLNAVLPPVLGVGLVFDRTTGNETYTYNLSLTLR